MAFAFWAPVVNGEAIGFHGPLYASGAYARCTLGGEPLPGNVEVSITKARAVDKKKAPGNDYARTTIHGIEPAEVTITLTLWTPEQVDRLNEVWPKLFPPGGKSKPDKALDIVHPAAKLHDIKSVVVVSGSGPNPASPARARAFVIKAIEWRPASKKKSATVTPVQPKGSLLDPGRVPGPGQNSTIARPFSGVLRLP